MTAERIGRVVPGTKGWTDAQGLHWQAYVARCAGCGEIRWPTLTAPPPPDWRCRRCLSQGGSPDAIRAAWAGE